MSTRRDLDSILEDAIPCVIHTHAVYQFAPEDRHSLYALLVERSALRDVVVRIGMERPRRAAPYSPSPSTGTAMGATFGNRDYHGAWLAWNADSVRHA